MRVLEFWLALQPIKYKIKKQWTDTKIDIFLSYVDFEIFNQVYTYIFRIHQIIPANKSGMIPVLWKNEI